MHTVTCAKPEQLSPCPVLAHNLSDTGVIIPGCGCCFGVQKPHCLLLARTGMYELLSQIITINYILTHLKVHQTNLLCPKKKNFNQGVDYSMYL